MFESAINYPNKAKVLVLSACWERDMEFLVPRELQQQHYRCGVDNVQHQGCVRHVTRNSTLQLIEHTHMSSVSVCISLFLSLLLCLSLSLSLSLSV